MHVRGAELAVIVEVLEIVRAAQGGAPAGPVLHVSVRAQTRAADQARRPVTGQEVTPAQVEGEPGGLLDSQVRLRAEVIRAVVEKVRGGNVTLGRIERYRLGEASQSENPRKHARVFPQREDYMTGHLLSKSQKDCLSQRVVTGLLLVVRQAPPVIEAQLGVLPAVRPTHSESQLHAVGIGTR